MNNPSTNCTMRDIILEIIRCRTGAVSYQEIAGVILANWQRNDGNPIKSRLIQQVIRTLIDEHVLTFEEIKTKSTGAAPFRYYSIVKEPSRKLDRTVKLSEKVSTPTVPKKIQPAVDPDDWLRDLNIPKSKLKPIAGRKEVEALFEVKRLRKATSEVWDSAC